MKYFGQVDRVLIYLQAELEVSSGIWGGVWLVGQREQRACPVFQSLLHTTTLSPHVLLSGLSDNTSSGKLPGPSFSPQLPFG